MDYLKEINDKFPIRKTEEQKQSFRKYVIDKATEKGAVARVEKLDKHNNVVIGDPQTAKTVFTAHYDTPCASLFPNLMMPRNKGLFYLYQFVIIFLFLALSLTPAIIVGMNILQSEIAYAGIFLVIYFGLFFLCFKTFTNKHNANDNTSGVATILSIIDKLSKEQLEKVAFILFDNEEKGKLGSKAYSKDHSESFKTKPIINLDCVGNGNHVIFISKAAAESLSEYKMLTETARSDGDYNVYFYPEKGSSSNSDWKNFPCGISVMTCKKSPIVGFYTPRIHTVYDTVASTENIEFLSRTLTGFINNI